MGEQWLRSYIEEIYSLRQYRQEIFPYYQNLVSGDDPENIQHYTDEALKEHELPKPKSISRKLLGEFGEICATWHLESKENLIAITKIFFAGLPSIRREGLDIIGIRIHDEIMDICYAEVKARMNNRGVPSAVYYNKDSLAKQLSDERLQEIFMSQNYRVFGSKIWIFRMLYKNFRFYGLQNIEDKLGQIVFHSNKYVRYGIIVHPYASEKDQLIRSAIDKAFDYIDEKCYRRDTCLEEGRQCSEDCNLRNPITFISIAFKRFNDILQEFKRDYRQIWRVI